MARYLCLNIHTERLADDKVWQKAGGFLDYLAKKQWKAIWFVLNPVFIVPGLSADDEKKWKSRLKKMAEKGQIIAQHSHFYQSDEQGRRKGKEYDLSRENALTRLREDRQWLESQGFQVKGFLSGAWNINKEILALLAKQGYQYDMSWNIARRSFRGSNSLKNYAIEKIEGILEAPATLTIKQMLFDLICFRLKRRALRIDNDYLLTLHFHDFDLRERAVLLALKIILFLAPFFKIRIIDFESFYEKIK